MSETPSLPDVLKQAIESLLTALANVVKGIADGLTTYSGLIATVLVLTGVAIFAWRGIERIVPFVRGILGRIF